jgi:N utilization substance protein A
MDPNALKAFIRLISKEKDLAPEVLKEAIEHAILSVSRKHLSQYRDAVVDLNVESGELTTTVTKLVAEEAHKSDREFIGLKEARKALGTRKVKVGQEVRVPIDPSELGRIAAQSARQIVMQRLRDAEHEKIYGEFKDKVGIMVTGIVQRFERRDVVLNIGKTEGMLPANEIPAGTHYKFNDRLRVLILRVEDSPRGPNIILSRKTPQLVIELFRQEVPEIADGTVQIVGIAREAGVRTKIAVKSNNSDVDPVGACVGMKGSRVQMVVRELENEKIDIVPWSPDSATFIRNALNPAKIVGIELEAERKAAHVIVAQGNLAIAIGRKGQNTKLAARLTGYRLDIRSENEEELAYEEIQRRYLEDFLTQIEGLSEIYKEAILRSNFNSVEKIARAELDKLTTFTGGNVALAQNLIAGAPEYLEALRVMEQEEQVAKEEREAIETAENAAESEESVGDDPETEESEGTSEEPSEEPSDEAAEEAEEASDGPLESEEEAGEAEPDEELEEDESQPAVASDDDASPRSGP